MSLKLDDNPNYIQDKYDEGQGTANRLRQAEDDAAFSDIEANYDKIADDTAENENIRRLKDRENESTWATNLDSFADSKGFNKSPNKFNIKGIAKKGGPVGSIIGLLLGGAGLLSFFGGPGLLIVNFVEQYTNAFNTQLASMDARMSKIVSAKLKNTVKGPGCKLPTSAFCKYSTFSQKELDNFKANKLIPQDVKTTVTGRFKISGFELESKEIVSASDFTKRMKDDIDFRNNVTKSYGGIGGLKYAGTWDKVANTWKAAHGINFARAFKEGATDEERRKVVDDLSQGKEQASLSLDTTCANREPKCSAEELAAEEQKNKNISDANDLTKDAGELSSTEESAASKAGKGAGSFGSLMRGVGILGAADSVCTFIGFARNVGLVSKTTQLNQMIQFSTIFLTMHSMIKAGDAVDQDVSFVGDLMTQTFTDKNGNTTKAATDSFGYRNAAYGDTGIDKAASSYVIGANFGGESTGVMQKIISTIAGAGAAAGGYAVLRNTCKFVNNPFVVGASIVVGVLSLFIPGVNVAKLSSQLAISGAIIGAQEIMLAKLGDISKGVLVGKNDSREGVGNIMNVASSSMLMGIGNKGGNPLLTKTQSRAVFAQYNETKLAYAQMDRRNLSPLDATSDSTFVGSIYSRMLPYIARSKSAGGTFASLLGMNSSILSNFFPSNAFAADTAQSCEDQDPDIKNAGFATTEFCVPLTGTDPQYLGIDPLDATEFLVNKGLLDADTDEFTEKAKPFIESCIERDEMQNPYGYSGENFDQENGKGCLINDANVAYFAPTGAVKAKLAVASEEDLDTFTDDEKVAIYIHTQDKRNNDILENGLPNPSSGTIVNTGGTGVSGSDQELAIMISKNSNINFDMKYAYQIANYIKGDFSCKINSNILKLIASLGETHKLQISSLNRYCTSTLMDSGSGSLHYANGGGSAVDFSMIDGAPATGGRPVDIQVYEEAMAILPDKKLQLGQQGCRPAGAVTIPAGNSSVEVPDTCHHVHIGVYP